MNFVPTSTTKSKILKTFIKRFCITLCCLYVLNSFASYITISPLNMILTSFIYVIVHSIVIIILLSLKVLIDVLGNYIRSRLLIHITFYTMLLLAFTTPAITNYILNHIGIIHADIMMQILISTVIVLTAIKSLSTDLDKSE